jgi:hypothetical protein
MCQQVGVEEEIQLVLWILGFLRMHADGKMSTTGTTLIRPQDYDTPLVAVSSPPYGCLGPLQKNKGS